MLEKRLLMEMLRRMVRIRRFEERVIQLVERGELVGAAHSYIGEEAVAVGACLALRDDDWITGPPLLYCPQGDVTRAEMAVFLVRAFDLTVVP
ncbi:MAG: thiamine pyrophosphate-dependent enzyme [Dehalococcoidia bacterium]